jgi:hypothetical protein
MLAAELRDVQSVTHVILHKCREFVQIFTA